MISDTITISYDILELGVHKKFDGIDDVVYEIRMDVCGSNKEGMAVKFLHVLHLNLSNLDKDSFISLYKLKKSDIIQWIENNLNSSTREYFFKKLEELFDPPMYYFKPSFPHETKDDRGSTTGAAPIDWRSSFSKGEQDVNIVAHIDHLKYEIEVLRTMIQPHGTGHIITAIEVLERRIREMELGETEEVLDSSYPDGDGYWK